MTCDPRQRSTAVSIDSYTCPSTVIFKVSKSEKGETLSMALISHRMNQIWLKNTIKEKNSCQKARLGLGSDVVNFVSRFANVSSLSAPRLCLVFPWKAWLFFSSFSANTVGNPARFVLFQRLLFQLRWNNRSATPPPSPLDKKINVKSRNNYIY